MEKVLYLNYDTNTMENANKMIFNEMIKLVKFSLPSLLCFVMMIIIPLLVFACSI